MRRSLTFFLCISFGILSFRGYSQVNLVINNDFETYSSCPTSTAQITLATGWFQPNLFWWPDGSTDYYNSCSSSFSATVPNNWVGYQLAKNGMGYAGIALYNQAGSDSREYLEGQLSLPLDSGGIYCVSFYISLSNRSQFSTDRIGLSFSSNSVTYNSSSWSPLPNIPNIENSPGNCISDTVNWVEISGLYTAQGGEQYFVIGNFHDDTNSTICNSYPSAQYGVAYYYIDDVSVVNCDSVNSVLNVSDGPALSVYPNPTQGIFHVHCEASEDGFLSVHSSLGQLVLVKAFNKSDSTSAIDLSDQPNGLYFVSVQTEKGTSSKRVLLTR
jgi:hypothetical protein